MSANRVYSGSYNDVDFTNYTNYFNESFVAIANGKSIQINY